MNLFFKNLNIRFAANFIISFLPLLIYSCSEPEKTPADSFESKKEASSNSELQFYDFRIEKKIPHSTGAFTQGLTYFNGHIYESCGKYGKSFVQKLTVPDGKLVKKIKIPDKFFAEGSTLLNGKLYMCTWKKGVGFIFSSENLDLISDFYYSGEGWGLTNNGKELILSDGSSFLKIIDSKKFKIKREIQILKNGKALENINELEFVNGHIYANIWKKDLIVIADLKTGGVIGEIDLSFPADKYREKGVLNGIAYNPEKKIFYLSGKNWPFIFAGKIIEKK